ncbi:MAG: GntP family permease [Verrucomicrobiota bacterium]|nr:GntP family permease [Verrucomicrobiota bacterium]
MTHDWILLALTFAAIGLLVLLVTRWKVNPFIALTLASLLVGGGAVVLGVTAVVAADEDPRALTMLDVVKSFQTGLGGTLGGIAAVLGLGTMLGKLLAESGGAEVLAKRFNQFFGPERVGWCIIALALAVGLATWFAVGLILLLPILLTLTRETKRPFLLLAIPLLSFLSVMHGLMPPHPGPVVAIEKLHASMGKVLLWGFLIGIPTAAIAGPIFARWAVKHVAAEPPEIAERFGATHEGVRLPDFALTLFSILLPILLLLVGTVVELLHAQGTPLGKAGMFIGNPTIALLISVLFATWSLGVRCGYRPADLLRFTELSIATIGMTLLVVGGGGGFARVLTDSGVANTLGELAARAHLSTLLYGWLVSAFIRVATGSATVAITVASGLLVPVLAEHPEVNVELLIIAIGCGSLFLSHLNDGGFWVVRDCLGLTVTQTLRTWTVTETIVGIAGLCITLAVHAVWQMIYR